MCVVDSLFWCQHQGFDLIALTQARQISLETLESDGKIRACEWILRWILLVGLKIKKRNTPTGRCWALNCGLLFQVLDYVKGNFSREHMYI